MNERIVRRSSGSNRGWLLSLKSLSNRILIGARDREAQLAKARALLPSVRERQSELIDFYGRYESLVETLCDAAQRGPTSKLELDYLLHRNWIEANYQPLRKFVVAYLRYSAEDAAQGLALWGRSADAFEALIAAPSLVEFIEADDGSMISRINRTREALGLYGDHLRHLAATSA